MNEKEIKQTPTPDEAPKPEKDLEKYKEEKANLMGAKSLLVFLRNTKNRGVEAQKQILKDVFKKKDKNPED